MRTVLKVVPLAALGCAAAFLVACGDRSGLLSSGQAASLQDALGAVQSACAGGDAAGAAVAARSFAGRVSALPPNEVDRQLADALQRGASTLETLVARTCTVTARTTTATTTTPTVTTTATTTPTEPTTPTTGTTTTPTVPTTPTTPPDNGGGTPGEGDEGSGGPPGNPGGAAPGQLKKRGAEG